MALPRRCAVSIYLRRRIGALLLAAARLSRQAARRVYGGRYPARVHHGEVLRAYVHGILRPLRFLLRFLARRANDSLGESRSAVQPAGTDPIARLGSTGGRASASDSGLILRDLLCEGHFATGMRDSP